MATSPFHLKGVDRQIHYPLGGPVKGSHLKGCGRPLHYLVRRNGDAMATSPFHLKGCGWLLHCPLGGMVTPWPPLHSIQRGVDGNSIISKEEWRWHGHLSIPFEGVWMATPLSLRRNGDGMATSPFHLKGCGWLLQYLSIGMVMVWPRFPSIQRGVDGHSVISKEEW